MKQKMYCSIADTLFVLSLLSPTWISAISRNVVSPAPCCQAKEYDLEHHGIYYIWNCPCCSHTCTANSVWTSNQPNIIVMRLQLSVTFPLCRHGLQGRWQWATSRPIIEWEPPVVFIILQGLVNCEQMHPIGECIFKHLVSKFPLGSSLDPEVGLLPYLYDV